MANLSTLSFSARIWPIKSEASLLVMAAAMTLRETPQARPRAILEGTYTCAGHGQHCCTDIGDHAFDGLTHVGGVLVLGQERDVQQDSQGSGVGSEDDDLGGSSVKGLRGLVGTLLQLAVVAGRLDDVEDFLAKSWLVSRIAKLRTDLLGAGLFPVARTWDRAASAMGHAADSFWLDILFGDDGSCSCEDVNRVPFRRSPCVLDGMGWCRE